MDTGKVKILCLNKMPDSQKKKLVFVKNIYS